MRIKIFKVLSYKIIFILFLTLVIQNCSKENTMKFCMGIKIDLESGSSEAKEYNCGTKFEFGDLTAIINSKSPFETDKIIVKIFELNEKEPIDIITVNVKRDQKKCSAKISIYNGGKYVIKAYKNNTEFSKGDLEIVF
jgi:hypothetical protein